MLLSKIKQGYGEANVSPDVSELVFAMNSPWEKNSFSDGADVKGTLFLFFWLKSGTDRKPDGEIEGNTLEYMIRTDQDMRFEKNYTLMTNIANIKHGLFLWMECHIEDKENFEIKTIIQYDEIIILLIFTFISSYY